MARGLNTFHRAPENPGGARQKILEAPASKSSRGPPENPGGALRNSPRPLAAKAGKIPGGAPANARLWAREKQAKLAGPGLNIDIIYI